MVVFWLFGGYQLLLAMTGIVINPFSPRSISFQWWQDHEVDGGGHL